MEVKRTSEWHGLNKGYQRWARVIFTFSTISYFFLDFRRATRRKEAGCSMYKPLFRFVSLLLSQDLDLGYDLPLLFCQVCSSSHM